MVIAPYLIFFLYTTLNPKYLYSGCRNTMPAISFFVGGGFCCFKIDKGVADITDDDVAEMRLDGSAVKAGHDLIIGIISRSAFIRNGSTY